MKALRPPVDEPLATTTAGHPERRKRQRRAPEDGASYVTRAEFATWRNRVVLLLLLFCAIASGSAYLSFHAGKRSTNTNTDSIRGLARNGAQATFATCVSGVRLRITIARGFDDLRTLAIASKPKADRDAFIARTQPAIDAALSEAAGVPVKTIPPGGVTPKQRRRVQVFGEQKCLMRATRSFGADAARDLLDNAEPVVPQPAG